MLKKYFCVLLGTLLVWMLCGQSSQQSSLSIGNRLKETTEMSIGLGTRFLTGDVTTSMGLDISGEIRRSLDHVFSVRGGVQYYPNSSSFSVGRSATAKKDPKLDVPQVTDSDRIVSEGFQANLELMVALNQLAVRKTRRFSVYGFIGVGGILSSVTLEGEMFNVDLAGKLGLSKNFFTACFNAGAGFGYRLSERASIYIEHRSSYMFGGSNADIHDGYVFSSQQTRSSLTDLYHVDRLRLAVNLGKIPKRSIPFWWVSPLDKIKQDLADIKARAPVDLTDSDGDGVIDAFDLEPYSEKDAFVDTRGITLDSDHDGVPDHRDLEPYSPAGAEVNKQGVATKITYDYNKERLEKELDERLESLENPDKIAWFLPLVLFDVTSPLIRNQEYSKLSQVATVLNLHPSHNLIVKGFANGTDANCSQNFLAYMRAKSVHDFLILKHQIAPERLYIHYGTDAEANLPNFKPKPIQHRVEFIIHTDESSMEPPPRCN